MSDKKGKRENLDPPSSVVDPFGRNDTIRESFRRKIIGNEIWRGGLERTDTILPRVRDRFRVTVIALVASVSTVGEKREKKEKNVRGIEHGAYPFSRVRKKRGVLTGQVREARGSRSFQAVVNRSVVGVAG